MTEKGLKLNGLIFAKVDLKVNFIKSVFSESNTFSKTIYDFLVRFPVILLSDQDAHCWCT